LFIVAGLSFAAPVITIVQSIGPGGSSPNDAAYALNALEGLRNGTTGVNTNIGTGTGASTYNRLVGLADPSQFIDSSTAMFNSWLGLAPGAIAGEFGNRLYFGVTVKSTQPFSLSNFVYYDNFYNNAVIPYNTIFDSYDGEAIVGISYGPDGVLGGGDDIIRAGGAPALTNNTLLVNELYYRGYNSAIDTPAAAPGQEEQQILTQQRNTAVASIAGLPVPVVAYGVTIGNVSTVGSASAAVAGVPEPSTYALFGAGLAALAFARRRRRS